MIKSSIATIFSFSPALLMENSRIRIKVLPPLIITILILQGLLVAAVARQQRENILNAQRNTEQRVTDLLTEEIRTKIQIMDVALEAVARAPRFIEGMVNKDQDKLREHGIPFFEELKKDQDITHFYFHQPDRIVFLRLHSDIQGDLNERETILRAEAMGQQVVGIEQGVVGYTTLRMVKPWKSLGADNLLGYLELGVEVEDILTGVGNILGVEMVLAIDKDQLDRERWEAQMESRGKPTDWEQLPNLVVTNTPMGER